MPKLSVIMGAYNCGHSPLLHRAVSSILIQTYRDFEFIICDDGSSDCTWDTLLEIQKQDSRIVLLRNETNKGLAHALNHCLSVAKGDYIARMDDDDYSYENRFFTQMLYLEQNYNVSFVGSNVQLVRNGARLGERRFPQSPTVENFYMTQPFIHPTLIFRSEVLDSVGGYSEETYCVLCEDYDLLLRLYERKFVGANIEDILFDYTISQEHKRKMKHRWNEVITRYHRFKALGVLPGASLYIIKPIIVGLLPVNSMRTKRGCNNE